MAAWWRRAQDGAQSESQAGRQHWSGKASGMGERLRCGVVECGEPWKEPSNLGPAHVPWPFPPVINWVKGPTCLLPGQCLSIILHI